MKPKIMIFCDYYLPSYKSGGGMWTVVNLVERFRHQYDFFIVARNYDSKGDTKPYTTVTTDAWNRTGNANVYYFSEKKFTQKKIAELIGEIQPDAFFLNSVFATPVVKFLEARRKKLFAEKPVILAPCGEMSKGALSVRSFKKKVFLKYAKTVNLFRDIIWKGSFDAEKAEIQEVIGAVAEVLVAPDLAPKRILPEYAPAWKPRKEKGAVKLVFMSRLVRKKNIHYLLERLRSVNEGKVDLDIVGPLEDQEYWRECLAIIGTLPSNISVSVSGAFPEQIDVLKKVSESHFFSMPTLNENFGYVFIEALACGCPLVISDRTVWEDIEDENAGWRIPLENESAWIAKINQLLAMENEEYQGMSAAARAYSEKWLDDPKFDEATARGLSRALENRAHNTAATNIK